MVASNIFPIDLLVVLDCAPIRCPFKFEKMWLRDGHLRDLIKTWYTEASGCMAHMLSSSSRSCISSRGNLRSGTDSKLGMSS